MSEFENTKNIERLLDVEMGVTVRFGATKIPLREVVHFGNGSMIELNRMVDEPVELLVNNFPFARGEVVVIDGYYSVKITEIQSPEKRSSTFFPKTQTESIQNFEPQKTEAQDTESEEMESQDTELEEMKTPNETVESEQTEPLQTIETDEVPETESPNPVQQDEPIENEE